MAAIVEVHSILVYDVRRGDSRPQSGMQLDAAEPVDRQVKPLLLIYSKYDGWRHFFLKSTLFTLVQYQIFHAASLEKDR